MVMLGDLHPRVRIRAPRWGRAPSLCHFTSQPYAPGRRSSAPNPTRIDRRL